MAQNDPRKGQRRGVLFVNTGDIKENDTIVVAVSIRCIPQHLQSGIQETRPAFIIAIGILSKNSSS